MVLSEAEGLVKSSCPGPSVSESERFGGLWIEASVCIEGDLSVHQERNRAKQIKKKEQNREST